jgi:hypothetical protein
VVAVQVVVFAGGGGATGGQLARGGPVLQHFAFLTLFKSLCRELYMLLGTDAAQMCREDLVGLSAQSSLPA